MLCLCNICFNIRELFGKAGFIPILNNRFDDKSKMKTVVEDRKFSHRLIGLYTQEDGNSWWSSRRTWRWMDMQGKCLRFRSDPERTCKWIVCLTLDFILC